MIAVLVGGVTFESLRRSADPFTDVGLSASAGLRTEALDGSETFTR